MQRITLELTQHENSRSILVRGLWTPYTSQPRLVKAHSARAAMWDGFTMGEECLRDMVVGVVELLQTIQYTEEPFPFD